MYVCVLQVLCFKGRILLAFFIKSAGGFYLHPNEVLI